ncbi:hypothetical protein ACI2K4_16535 [Micromonospora sp. NPDC050397]|uniref:hypothetical protein n=1 Tax=Micromonospora sp. NPDC050397 TaxID=3364279 RepID=UPI00384EA101
MAGVPAVVRVPAFFAVVFLVAPTVLFLAPVAAREVVDFAVVAFLAGAFFAVARVPGAVDRAAVVFFAGAFLAGAFFAVLRAPTVFFTADLVPVALVAVDLVPVDLAAVVRLAGAFFAAFFTAPAARVAAEVAFFRAVVAFDATVFFAVVDLAAAFFAGAFFAGAFLAAAGRVADVRVAAPVLLRAAVVFFAPVVLRAAVVFFTPVRLAAGRLVAFDASAIWVLLAGHALGGLLVETAEYFDDAGSVPRRYLSSPAQRASSASHSSLRCRTFSSACSASWAEAYGPRT